jgi:hypothetical protein
MRAQAQELVKIAKGLKAEIQKQEYFDSRVRINDHVDVYANDAKDYVHVQFNKKGKTVDINIHEYNEAHYSETLTIDLSIIDHELDKIVERSQGVLEEFIYIYSNRSEEIKQERITELELEISKLRGDVPVI